MTGWCRAGYRAAMRGDRRIWWGAVAAALATGLAFRLWHVFAEPLWLDEAYSAFAADHDLAFLWQVVPRYETHPPFYYTLLHAWVAVAGDGVAALRLPGLVAGLATLPVMAAAALDAGALLGWDGERRRRRLAGVAAALAAVSVQLVLMSRQVRPYPLLILAYAVAIWLLLRLRGRVAAGRPIAGPALAGYLLAVELLLWLHNMGPLFAAAASLALAVAIVGRRMPARDWAWLAAGHLAVALAYMPGLRILSAQAPTWIATTWLRLNAGDVLGHLQLLYAAPDAAALAAIGLAGAAAAVGRRPGGRVVVMLFVLALLPVTSSLLLSVTVAPVFITRTMAPAAVPAVLLFAIGATAWHGWRATLALAAAAVLALGCAAADLVDARAGPMQDWYGLVDWLGPRLRPGDAVLAYPNEGALPLGFALRDRGVRVPVLPIPAPVPAFAEPGAWYPSGSRGVVALGDARLRAVAASPRVRAIPTIWLLRLSRQLYDPRGAGLRAFAAGRRPVAVFRAGDLEVRGLSRRPDTVGKRP